MPYLVVVLVQIKRSLQAKLLDLDFVQIGSTLATHLALHCFLFFLALFLCTLYFFLAHLIWYHFEASLIVKLHLLSIKILDIKWLEVASF